MNNILALTLGSKKAKAILAKLEEKSPELLGTGESPIKPGAIKNGIISDLKSVIISAERAVQISEEKKHVPAKNTILSLSNELVKGNTASIQYTRKDPESPITNSEIEDLLKVVQEKSSNDIKKLITLETGNKSIELCPLSSAIVDLKIDGESVMEPVGHKGSKLSMLVYSSFAPLLQVADLEKLCSELDLELISIIAEPYAIARAALKINPKFSGVLLNVGSDKTNLTILEKGILIGTRTFAIGSEKLQTVPEAWISSLAISLEDLNLPLIPSKVFLSGDGADLEALQESLALSDWYETLPFKTRPIIDLFPKKNPVLLGLLEISSDFS